MAAPGHLAHFDGARFVDTPAPSDAAVSRFSAAAPDRAYAVGVRGGVFRWDGTIWKKVESALAVDLVDVWTSADGKAFIVGAPGRVLTRAAR